MRVRVYYNLNRAVWSIKAMDGEHKGRVIGYAKAVTLRDAHTVVSEAGRQRVLREKRKNVHAYIDGQLEGIRDYTERLMTPRVGAVLDSLHSEVTLGDLVPLHYNPYKVSHFSWVAFPNGYQSAEGDVMPEVYLRDDRTVHAIRPRDGVAGR